MPMRLGHVIRAAVFLSSLEFGLLLNELAEEYDDRAGARLKGHVNALRDKIVAAITAGERVVICPDKLKQSGETPLLQTGSRRGPRAEKRSARAGHF